MVPARSEVHNSGDELERSIKAAMMRMKKVSADSDDEDRGDEEMRSSDWENWETGGQTAEAAGLMILHNSGLTAYVAARVFLKTLNFDPTGSMSDFSVMLSDAFSFSESGQGVGTIVQIHFICRNSHSASITLRSMPI